MEATISALSGGARQVRLFFFCVCAHECMHVWESVYVTDMIYSTNLEYIYFMFPTHHSHCHLFNFDKYPLSASKNLLLSQNMCSKNFPSLKG